MQELLDRLTEKQDKISEALLGRNDPKDPRGPSKGLVARQHEHEESLIILRGLAKAHSAQIDSIEEKLETPPFRMVMEARSLSKTLLWVLKAAGTVIVAIVAGLIWAVERWG